MTLVATGLLWAAIYLTAHKSYWDIKEDRPHWEGRAELLSIAVCESVLLALVFALGVTLGGTI